MSDRCPPHLIKHSNAWLMAIAATAGCSAAACWMVVMGQRRSLSDRSRSAAEDEDEDQYTTSSAYERQIGNTPCTYLPRLSRLLKRHCWVKLENANPGGTGKDRAALRIIETAEAKGELPKRSSEQSPGPVPHPHNHDPSHNGSIFTADDYNDNDDLALIHRAMQHSRTGGLVVEGTSGSTGISLATISAVRGHACLVVLPDDQAREKRELLETLGAVVKVVTVAAIAHPHHYVNVARRLAHVARTRLGVSALFGNQFETERNAIVHYETTGPEIWHQCQPDAFVMSAGTGGTMAGVGKYLKEQRPHCQIVLVDPVGSVLANKVMHGIAFTAEQQERTLRRHRYDSIAEGIGLDRISANFAAALPHIDVAYTITDQDALDMARWMLTHEGLLIGSSTAMNLVGTVRFARRHLHDHDVICTIGCDSGQRHLTRFWNRAFVESQNLCWPSADIVPIDLQNLS